MGRNRSLFCDQTLCYSENCRAKMKPKQKPLYEVDWQGGVYGKAMAQEACSCARLFLGTTGPGHWHSEFQSVVPQHY